MNVGNKFLLVLLLPYFLLSQEIDSLAIEEPETGIILSGSSKTEYWLFLGDDSLIRKTEHFETNTSFLLNYEQFFLTGNLFLYEPSRPKKPLRLISGSLEYRTPSLEASFGDFYALYGRGLVLRSYYDENFRYDKRLFGVQGRAEFWHNEIRLLSARPRNIFFSENAYRFENDTNDIIRAVEFNSFLIPNFELSGRYLRLNRESDLTPQAFTEVFGPGIAFNYKSFEVYYEYAHKLQTREVIGGRKKGDGHYFNLSFSSSLLGILLEYEDYDSIDLGGVGFRYNDPPTPIKKGISVNRGVDERGFGITGSLSLNKMKWEGNYAWLYTHKKEKGIREGNSKFEFELSEGFIPVFTGEYLKTTGIEAGIPFREEIKPGLEIRLYSLERNFTLGGSFNWVKEGETSYQERGVSLSADLLPDITLTLNYEMATKAVKRYDYERQWLLVECSLSLMTNLSLRFRVGREKGGLVCSGGVCRYEPPFSGIKGVLVARF
jgi:hypothetical protein